MDDQATSESELRAPARRDYITIFLLSCSLLIFQIALTRVLSVVVWYHFAFLTISMVMLGLGAPGVWFALMRRPLRLLPACLLASGITVPLATILIIKNGTTLLASGSAIWIILCVLPAMLSLGSAICLLLMKATGAHIQRMYGIDLIGACLGAVVIVPLLHWVPTPELAACCGLLPLLAALQYGPIWRACGAALAIALVVVMTTTPLLKLTHCKVYDEALMKPVFEKWTPTARLTIFDESFWLLQSEHKTGFSWGRGSKYPSDQSTAMLQYWLEQDGSAGTPITKFDGDLSKTGHLDYDITTLGYQLRPPERVVVIGGGGGRDILSALRAGAADIEAVELNRHTIAAVSETFGNISGDIYHRPGVTAFANEGRSHLTHSEGKYDFIQISLIDSWAASAAGAFALAESNLYTSEAYQLYFDRLNEGGILSTSRWLGELPRLLLLGRSALEQAGFASPEKHVLMASAGSVATVLISKTPFAAEDIARLTDICEQRGFDVQYPTQPGKAANAAAIDLIEGRNQVLADHGLNVDPPTDDSPYFFHLISPFADASKFAGDAIQLTGVNLNLSSTLVLRQAMFLVSLLAVILFLLPFLRYAVARRAVGQQPVRWGSLLQSSLFFATIGAGFMLLENMLLQHFVLYLGHPSYATTVIISSLLLGMGVGSMAAGRLGIAGLCRLGWLVPVAILLVVSALPTLFAATLGLPLALRITIACVILVPLGGALGTFFPLGMMRFGDTNKPWYWAINGVFGVVASVMSLALSMEFGFLFVGQLSAFIYLLAWLCLQQRRAQAVA